MKKLIIAIGLMVAVSANAQIEEGGYKFNVTN